MSVQPGPTEKRYAANGVSLIYTVPFLVIEAGDLQVLLNGTLITSGFTHVGVGLPISYIEFVTPPTGDLFLQLNVPFQRLVDYQENGDFLSSTVNRDFDRIWQALKQLLRTTERSPVLGINDIDGQGFYRAKGNGLIDLASAGGNPTAATNLQDVLDYVASILETGQGPINNATNVAYVDGDGVATSVQKGILKQFSSVASLKLSAGAKDGEPAVLLSYYSSAPGIGGGMVRWSSTSTLADDGGYCFAVTGVPVGRWLRTDRVLDLYQFGGAYQGNCIAAFDLAMASTFMYIKVPDKVVLGYHVFSAPIKFVRGGDQVSFSTFPAGILPTLCGYVKIHGFTNLTMAVHPLSGGNIENAQFFISLGSGADIGTIVIVDNDGTGGRAGILASFENGRFLRKSCVIANNYFKGQNGTDGGEGYGIQYANQNEFGDAHINYNTVEEDGRHGIYIARNPGGGKVTLIGNTVRRHRWNSPTQGGQTRGAIQITRSANVHGFGNMVSGFYDSAIMIIEEADSESATPISAANITMTSTTLHGPANDTPAIFIGSGVASVTSRVKNVVFRDTDFESTGHVAAVVQYNWGQDVKFDGTRILYKTINSGAIRPFVLLGDTVTNSNNLTLRDTTISTKGCAGAAVEVFRISGSCVTSNIPLLFDGLRVIESDATSLNTFGPSAPISNTKVQINRMDLTGFAATSKPQVIPNPSQPWNGQITSASILTPVGVLNPAFIGQEAYLTNNSTFWKASGLANTNWIQIS